MDDARGNFFSSTSSAVQRIGQHIVDSAAQSANVMHGCLVSINGSFAPEAPLDREYAHLPIESRRRYGHVSADEGRQYRNGHDRPACGIRLNNFEQALSITGRANRSSQIPSFRTFRSGSRAECSARSTVPSFSGRQRSARCPSVRLPCRRRPSCKYRRRRFPYHSSHH